MSRAPSIQFYFKDWLSDPAVQAMSFDEQGRYMRTICMTLQTDTPGVMTEDEVRRFCCYSEAEWVEHRARMSAAFRVGVDGRWTQKRVVEDQKARRNRLNQALNGARVTNEKRWGSIAQRRVGSRTATSSASHSDTYIDRSASRSAIAPSSSSASAIEEKTRPDQPLGVGTSAANGGPAHDPAPVGLPAAHLETPRTPAEIDRDAREFELARQKAAGGGA